MAIASIVGSKSLLAVGSLDDGEESKGTHTSCRHVLRTKHDLHGDERNLHPGPGADAREDLVANPFAGAGVHLQRLEQASADGEDGRAEPHKWRIPAEGSNKAADDDGGDGDADEVGDRADAGSFGCSALDGLEVER